MERSVFRGCQTLSWLPRRSARQCRSHWQHYKPRSIATTASRHRLDFTTKRPLARGISLQSHRSSSEVLSGAQDDTSHLHTTSRTDAQQQGAALLSHQGVPTEEETLGVLTSLEAAATQLMTSSRSSSLRKHDQTPASVLLELQPDVHSGSTSFPPTSSRTPTGEHPPVSSSTTAQNDLSSLALDIISFPPVFITPKILHAYVSIQSILQRPGSFPKVFTQYAQKPVPQSKSRPIRYREPNPRRISQAVPKRTADLALRAAFDAKPLGMRNLIRGNRTGSNSLDEADTEALVLALSIINTTYSTTAYRRAKVVTQAMLPMSIAATAPIVAWSLAGQFSTMQTGMDAATMTQVAFAGMLTYAGAVATIGVVALTTANDQMQRVTWAPGMPLRDRWIREDERAALDQVALTWGFKEKGRWGEEEGEAWEGLREWIGLRGMVLDQVSLMEGMQ